MKPLIRSIITRITVAMSGNYQFLHTIGNDIYIYAFGDRIGQVTVSGLAMAGPCSSCDTGPTGKKHGFDYVYRWYLDNRLAARKAPVRVTLGDTNIDGFVVGLSGDAVDPQTRIMQYNLQIAAVPFKNNSSASSS